ncbi:MAG: hypothetical protein JWR34_6486 [Mycobacterium sp.]|nr:hypothetical protein [Mycobacterium sp.]
MYEYHFVGHRSITEDAAQARQLGEVGAGVALGDIPSAVLRYESLRRERAAQVQRNSRNGGLVYDSGDSPERDEKLRGTVADLL